MATIYEKVIIPEKTVERISHVECDLCGKGDLWLGDFKL